MRAGARKTGDRRKGSGWWQLRREDLTERPPVWTGQRPHSGMAAARPAFDPRPPLPLYHTPKRFC